MPPRTGPWSATMRKNTSRSEIYMYLVWSWSKPLFISICDMGACSIRSCKSMLRLHYVYVRFYSVLAPYLMRFYGVAAVAAATTMLPRHCRCCYSHAARGTCRLGCCCVHPVHSALLLRLSLRSERKVNIGGQIPIKVEDLKCQTFKSFLFFWSRFSSANVYAEKKGKHHCKN